MAKLVLLSLMKDSSSSTILLLDGGISTELEQRQPNHTFPDRNLWSSSLLLSSQGQNDIEEVHESFFSAGSDIITTLTYQLSHYATKFGYGEDQIDGMLQRAVQIAKQSKVRSVETDEKRYLDAPPRFIVGSIGCYGAVLADGSEYTGQYNLTIEDLIKFHKRRVEILTKEDIDGIAFETIPSLREISAICQLMESVQYNNAVWLSLACKDGLSLNDGTPLCQALAVIDEIDPYGSFIHGIGINCCKVQHVNELSQLLATHVLESKYSTRRTIVIYPNSGEEWDASTNSWKEGSGCTNPEAFAKEVMRCIKGIHDLCSQRSEQPLSIFVGGCCRTTPDTIRALRYAVDEYRTEKDT